MLGVKNLRVVAASLCLSITLLSGCGSKENPNEIVIDGISKDVVLNYESEIPTGMISYDNVDEYVKVVKIKNETTEFNRLVILDKDYYTGSMRHYNPHTDVRYIDLKSGVIIIEYMDYSSEDEEDYWVTGKNFEVLEEINITNYLLQEDFVKREYEVSEILDFYEEKVLPTLDSSEKELIKNEKEN